MLDSTGRGCRVLSYARACGAMSAAQRNAGQGQEERMGQSGGGYGLRRRVAALARSYR